MSTRNGTLIGAAVLPLLAVAGVLLLIAARSIGGATPLTAFAGLAGLALCVAAITAGAAVFSGAPARAD